MTKVEQDAVMQLFIDWGESHDLAKLVLYKSTSLVESFHALCNKYAPKHMHRGIQRYLLKHNLARLHWNDLALNKHLPAIDSDKRDALPFQKLIVSHAMAQAYEPRTM
jgi:hypothetical protein